MKSPRIFPTIVWLLGVLLLSGCHRGIRSLPDRSGQNATNTLSPPPPLPADDAGALRERQNALAELRSATRSHPADPVALLRYVRAARSAGDYLSALEAIQAAPRFDDPAAQPVLMDEQGRCYLGLGLYKQALLLYGQLLSRQPQAAPVYVGLSRAQAHLGQTAEAIRTLNRGIRVVPADSVDDQVSLASILKSDHEYLPALAAAQAAYAHAPDDPQVALILADILSQLQRYPEERALLDTLLARQPGNAAVHAYLASLLENPLNPQRDLRQAEQQYQQALQDGATDAQIYAHLGALYKEQERYREAAAIFIRMLQINPDSTAGRLQLADAYLRMGDRRQGQAQQEIAQRLVARDQAETHLLAQIDRSPSDPQARLALGRHYLDAGQYSHALPVLQAAYLLAPSSGQTRRMLALLYQKLGLTQPTLAEKSP